MPPAQQVILTSKAQVFLTFTQVVPNCIQVVVLGLLVVVVCILRKLGTNTILAKPGAMAKETQVQFQLT